MAKPKHSTKKQQTDKPKHWRRLRGFARRWRQWSPKRRVVFVCAMILTTIIVLFAMFVALAAAAFTGFPYNVVRPIDPNSPRIVRAREKAEIGMDQEEKILAQDTGLKFSIRETANSCYKGDNGYKHQDGYASRCSFDTVYHYGLKLNGTNGLSQTLTKIAHNLKQNMWEEPISELDRPEGEPAWYEHDSLGDPGLSFVPPLLVGGFIKGKHRLDININAKNSEYPSVFEQNDEENKKTFDKIAKENDYVISIMIIDDYATKPSLRDGLF